MMADVMARVDTKEGAKILAIGYLKNEGWTVDQVDHVEAVSTPPIHDSRLNALFQSAQRRGLAAALSPYG